MRTRKKERARLSGRRLGEWVVGEAIGSGGFADVYRARQPRLDRDAVIKVLRISAADAKKRQRFDAEARLASQLDHPFAAHVYSYGTETDGLAWIAMELVRGQSLSERLKKDGPIPLAQFAPLFERLCEVVDSAHTVGLLHRDIKPGNVMVIKRAGKLLPKLLDFGIAASLDGPAPESVDEEITAENLEDGWTLGAADSPNDEHDTVPSRPDTQPLTSQSIESVEATRPLDADQTMLDSAPRNEVIGTPAYMAPERWSEHATVDHRSDIYSLGVLIQHCLTGSTPFRCGSVAAYAAAHVFHEPAALGPNFAPSIAEVVSRALAKNPADRFDTALELGQALRVAADPDATARLPREVANTWLLFAPLPIRESLAAFESARERRGAKLELLVDGLAQWIGIVSIAAVAGTPGLDASELAALGRGELGPREWLELAHMLTRQFEPSRFPVPELASWLADRDAGATKLLALSTLCQPDSSGRGEVTRIDLLAEVLRSLEFVCEYAVLIDRDAGRPCIWLADGDDNRLFPLSPLLASRSPTPGAAAVLFAAVGPSPGGALMRSLPSRFELDSEEVWPWLASELGVVVGASNDNESDRAPYRGLAPFREDDAELFFGRNRDVESLYNRVLAHPLVTLTGPSGSGKSSLVFAGLLGRLRRRWTVLTLRPGLQPSAAFDAALGSLRIPTDVLTWLSDPANQLAIVVDQAEELVTLAPRADAEAFTETLVSLIAAAPERVKVILTARDDFSARLGELTAWRGQFAASLLLVSPPSKEELTNMLLGPARRVGFDFDDLALVTEMVDDVLGQTGALPLLSFAAARLWARRERDAKRLTRAAYAEMGGVTGALATYAEETLAALPVRSQAAVREIIRRLVTGDGTRTWVARDDLERTCDPAVARHLVEARILIAAEAEDGSEQISIVHEALLTQWPRLVRWQNEDAAGLRFRDDLRAAVRAWVTHDRDPSYLWAGNALRTLEAWQDRWAKSFSAAEREFADASLETVRRKRQRRRMIVTGAIAALTVALVIMLVLNQRIRSAQQRANSDLTDLLERRGYDELIAGQRNRALVYLQAAYARGRDSPGLRVALSQSQVGGDTLRATAAIERGSVAIETPNVTSDEFFTTGAGSIRRWRWTGDTLKQVATYSHGGLHQTTFSSDNRVATVGSGKLRVYEHDGTVRAEAAIERLATGLQFVPDRELLVSQWGNGVAVWSYEAKRLRVIDAGTPVKNWTWVVPSDDGKLVAAFDNNADASFRVFRLADGAELARRDLGSGLAAAVFVGENLIVGLRSGDVLGLNVSTGKLIRRQVHGQPVRFRLSTNGKLLITESNNSPIRVLDTKTLTDQAILERPTIMAGASNAAYDRRATRIAIADGTRIEVRDAKSLTIVGAFDVDNVISSFAFSQDGDTLLVGTTDGALSAWAVRPEVVTIAASESGQVWSAKHSPSGDRITVLTTRGLEDYGLDGAPIRTTLVKQPVAPFGMPQARYSNDGALIVAPSNHRICGFDSETGLRVAVYSPGRHASAGAFGPGREIATSSIAETREANYLSVFDRDSEQLIVERTTEGVAVDIEFTPDGETILYATGTRAAAWRLSEATDAWSLEADGMGNIDISPDGSLAVATGGNTTIELWDTQTGAVIQTLLPPTPLVDAVAFAPSGKLLATASRDLSIYLWDLETGAAVAALRGHSAVIRDLDFGDDGSLVSTDRSGNVLIWKLSAEERSPEELGAVVDKLPYRLDGAKLVRRAGGIAE